MTLASWRVSRINRCASNRRPCVCSLCRVGACEGSCRAPARGQGSIEVGLRVCAIGVGVRRGDGEWATASCALNKERTRLEVTRLAREWAGKSKFESGDGWMLTALVEASGVVTVAEISGQPPFFFGGVGSRIQKLAWAGGRDDQVPEKKGAG